MQDATLSYRPVYHFREQHLFETFIEGIPRSALIEPFRNAESLRNRYFHEFRVQTIPLQQLVTAYHREIIDYHNGDLASMLCAVWIAQHDQLASVALQELGIESDEPGNARSWLDAVQAKLASDQYNVHPLVR